MTVFNELATSAVFVYLLLPSPFDQQSNCGLDDRERFS